MSIVELSELNGRVGNQDYFDKSREAEQLVLDAVSRFLRVQFTPTPGTGRHACDFTTSKGFQGDLKIFGADLVHAEISQIHRGVSWPGWFREYQKLPNMGGLLTLNTRFSKYHNHTVMKIRWLPWSNFADYVNNQAPTQNRFGSYVPVDPVKVEHYWLGDFHTVASRHGDGHVAFDTSAIHANNQLNIPQLYQWL